MAAKVVEKGNQKVAEKGLPNKKERKKRMLKKSDVHEIWKVEMLLKPLVW